MKRLIVLACAIVSAGNAAAQEGPFFEEPVPRVEAGARIRVTTADDASQHVGWTDAVTASGLRLVREEDHRLTVLPAEAIHRLEVSLERRSASQRFGPGALVGGIVGLVGGLIAASSVEPCPPNAFLCFDELERATRIMTGIGAGVVLGGGISFLAMPSEEWGAARLPASGEEAPAHENRAPDRSPDGYERRNP